MNKFLSIFGVVSLTMMQPLFAESAQTDNISAVQVFHYQTVATPKRNSFNQLLKNNNPSVIPAHQHQRKQNTQYYQKHLWKVIKSNDIFIKEKKHITELWHQSGNGIGLINVLNAEKMAIEYHSGDFDSMNMAIKWDDVTALVPSMLLKKAYYIPNSEFPYWQYETVVYKTNMNGSSFTIRWIPEISMPAQIVEETNSEVVETILLNAYQSDPIDIDEWLSRYVQTSYDFADIGDNESDPLLKKLMNSGVYYGKHKH